VKGRPDEGRDELWAREIVERILGVPVERFDDGTAPRQVDALVRYPDRVAALEVVTDHDPALTEQGAVLHGGKNPIEVSGLRQSWMVMLSREAKINDVKRALPELLPAWQDEPPPLSELHQLGIMSAEPIMTSAVSGHVWLTSGWGQVPRHRVHTAGDLVTKVLDEHPGKARKLEAHRDVAERHAFIWATPSSGMGVLEQLEPGDDHPLPVTAPTLPAGVTHVWVAGHWCQGVLTWFPGSGWRRTPMRWSSEGPATSSDLGD
jgi:hypothetical protein